MAKSQKTRADRLASTATSRATGLPAPVGDERWDALLAALGEHLAARLDLAPPPWAESRVLRRPWFPAELQVQRAEALVWAPAPSGVMSRASQGIIPEAGQLG
jgi:hypothetical protein